MNAVQRIRSARLAGGLAASLAAVLLLSLPTAGSAVAASPRVPDSRSGLRWPSGVFMPSYQPAAYNAFGTWRGAPTDVAITYTGRASWSAVIDPQWLFTAWKNTTETVVLSAPPYPDPPASPNALVNPLTLANPLAPTSTPLLTTAPFTTVAATHTLAACAQGGYDQYWRQFGTNVAAAGLANRTIVRLAWEFNGDWNPWSAFSPAQFVGCWRRIFTAAESTAPALRWDWTVNRGPSMSLKDPRAAWPGRRYVDIVGIDSYDGYPPVSSAAGWQVQYAGVGGLKFWADFARRKGKRLSVPEWGLYPGTGWAGHNGGDNKFYIAKMFGFFRQQGSRLAYEAYFNDDDPSQAGALKLNPIGAKEYRAQIRAARAPR